MHLLLLLSSRDGQLVLFLLLSLYWNSVVLTLHYTLLKFDIFWWNLICMTAFLNTMTPCQAVRQNRLRIISRINQWFPNLKEDISWLGYTEFTKNIINDLFQQWMDDKCIKIDFDIRDVKGFSFPLVISTSDL